MGLFDTIGRAVQEGKEKAEREAAPVIARIQRGDLRYGAETLRREFNHLSLPAKTKVMQVYRRKIQMTDDSDDLYYAFTEMYEMYSRRGDTKALNISQWLGKRLYDKGDSRVREKEVDNGPTMYLPSDRY